MKTHPVCDLFPAMSPEQYGRLRDDIKAHGQLEPGLTFKGFLIDGKHRFRICEELGIKFLSNEWEPLNGESVVEAAISRNLHRRHLSATERALIAQNAIPLFKEAAKARQAATLKKGKEPPVSANRTEREETPKNAVSPPNKGKAAAQAAKATGASTRNVEHLEKLKREAPDLHAKVAGKGLSLTAATAELKKRKAGESPAKDRAGKAVPEHLRAVFTEGDDRFEALRKLVQEMERQWKGLVEDGLCVHSRDQEMQAHIANLKAWVKFTRPHATCPYCGGKKCDACRKTGWVALGVYDAAPGEKK